MKSAGDEDRIATARQIEIVTEMFIGLGIEAAPERLMYYQRLLRTIQPDLLQYACDEAVLDRNDGYPPSPGEIRGKASRIRGEQVRRFREERDRRARAAEQRAALEERASRAP